MMFVFRTTGELSHDHPRTGSGHGYATKRYMCKVPGGHTNRVGNVGSYSAYTVNGLL